MQSVTGDHMKFAWLTVLAGSTFLATPAIAQTFSPSAAEVAQFAKSDGPQRGYGWASQTEPFDQALLSALHARSIPKAAQAMAPQFGLPAASLEKIIGLRIFLLRHQYDSVVEGNRVALRQRVLDLAPQLQGHELGTLLLAEMLDSIGEATAADVDALVAAAPEKAGLATLVAPIIGGKGAYAHAATLAGPSAMPVLIRWAQSGDIDGADKLAIYDWLTSPAALAQAKPDERADLSIRFLRKLLSTQLFHGLDSDALARLDALDPAVRDRVLSPDAALARTVTIAGIVTQFDDDEATTVAAVAIVDATGKVTTAATREAAPKPVDPFESDVGALRLDLAEAYLVAGRPDDARRMVGDLVDLAHLRSGFDCLFGQTTVKPEACGVQLARLPKEGHLARLLLIEAALSRRDADPYPIAEFMAGIVGPEGQAASAQLVCRVLPAPQFSGLCETALRRSYNAPEHEPSAFNRPSPEEQTEVARALELTVPDYVMRRSRMLAAMPPKPAAPAGWNDGQRETRVAAAPDYREQPIPPAIVTASPLAAPKGLAKLPAGFMLVRAERQGSQVVAISLSQTLDPVGEISPGGYWVHLSRDGGKRWDRPLYTGLIARWPYVAKETSALPLIAGDTVQLVVDIAEIDTASIIYPPVALRNRREVPDRYLTISLGDLTRDSDGDGITDVVAHHLLLDQPDPVRPYLVGSDKLGTCGGPASPERIALMAVLARLADPAVQAVVEPVQRTLPLAMLGWQKTDAAPARPVMLKGRPEDFRCLKTERPVLVFSDAALKAMKTLSPDFHAIDMPSIIFNRDKTRGFVNWSTGWAGGTLRLRLVDGHWQIDNIRQWIT